MRRMVGDLELIWGVVLFAAAAMATGRRTERCLGVSSSGQMHASGQQHSGGVPGDTGRWADGVLGWQIWVQTTCVCMCICRGCRDHGFIRREGLSCGHDACHWTEGSPPRSTPVLVLPWRLGSG